MLLVKQVLDRQIIDQNEEKVGKVDDIGLFLRPGHPPEVVCLYTRNGALARLLGRFGRSILSVVRTRLLGLPDPPEPSSISWDLVTAIDVAVHVAINRDEGTFQQTTRAVWDRWIGPLPGSRR